LSEVYKDHPSEDEGVLPPNEFKSVLLEPPDVARLFEAAMRQEDVGQDEEVIIQQAKLQSLLQCTF
jgi:hypothetical protein